jgi:predicted DNA-binding transcriptional regulator AlpA
METKTKLMSVKDYAAKHGCTVQNVYHLIKQGKVKARKIGSFHLVEVG